MLTKCPECDLQVSDKAYTCPHCGYPLKGENKARAKTKKRMRLPNGFGQISEIKGKPLRKPFRAMVTVGKTSTGKPICKILKPEGYFATYNEAYEALVEYNRNPYDLEPDITMLQLYERWSNEHFKTLKNPSSVRTITSCWAYCSQIYDMRVKDVRARHIKGCMENGTVKIKGIEKHASSGIKSRMKSMFNLMFDYALEYELVDKNYARTFELSSDIITDIEETRRGHVSFTEKEMEILWDNVNVKKYVDVILIQCYSGWRPGELGEILLENVDLDNWTFKGGMKTAAGTNRVVPIHSKIKELVKREYDQAVSLGSKYLINSLDTRTHTGSTKFTYDKYRIRMKNLINELGLNPDHRAHDGRVQFITMAKKYNVDEYAIKYMVGHEISDITEKVYTKRDTEWLKDEIEKIK